MEKRNGSVTSAQNDMLFNQIGRHTLKPVELENIDVIVFSRKDSFVTHRAFCDALTEENHKVNQNLAATGGMLQNQVQELFTSSMPSSDSGSNTNTMMNLSISNDNTENTQRPLSSNSAGVMILTNLDPIFNPRIPWGCLGTVGG